MNNQQIKSGSLKIGPISIDLTHVFFISCIIFVGARFFFENNNQIQFINALLGIFLYLITSFIHHYLDKSLTKETIIEYILLAGLVLTVLIVLIFSL